MSKSKDAMPGSQQQEVKPHPNPLKNYEVKLVAYAIVVVVAAESEEKAIEYATDEVSHGDFEIDETTIERELTTDAQVEQAKRHAHAVALPDEA